MHNVHCFTSISFSYLGRARVLARTLRQVHPDWTIWVCISDEAPPGFDFDGSEFDRVLFVHDLPVPELEGWIFQHNVVELCTAVKGLVLERILSEGASKVVYLDPDIAVFNDLEQVLDRLDSAAVVLTPHAVDPETKPFAVSDNEISALKHGVYNLGFVAVAGTDEGRRFARWWRDRLIAHCVEDVPNGLFTDQRWCDLVPAFFEPVSILRDPGFNVASWNLGQRRIAIERGTGDIRVNGSPLRFFHFTKIDHVGEHMLERYSDGNLAVFELMEWYKRLLRRHEPANLPAKWWRYGSFDDGVPVPQPARRAYRGRADLQATFPTPFSSGRGSFQEWWFGQQG